MKFIELALPRSCGGPATRSNRSFFRTCQAGLPVPSFVWADKHKLAPGDRTIAVTQQEISENGRHDSRKASTSSCGFGLPTNWVRLEHGAIVVLDAEPLQALVEAGSGSEGD